MVIHCKFLFWLTVMISLGNILFAQVGYFDQRSGVEVLFPSDTRIFPKQWSGKKVNPEIRPVMPEERTRMEELISHALSKYPPAMLSANLHKVCVLGYMKFYGLPYGGTNYNLTIYLSDDHVNPFFTDDYIEKVFHHEFSSILIRRYPGSFDKQKWLLLNPAGFKYGKGGANAIMEGVASMDLDPDLIEKGFLSEYSTASVEEDINVFAQNLFTGGREFWRLVDLNTKITEKTRLLISFYHSINPVFTESYFRGLQYNPTAQR